MSTDYELKDVIHYSVQNNRLLHAIWAHPQFNQTTPRQSPKPLFYVADFIRTTYLNYMLRLLPEESIIKSRKLTNPRVWTPHSETQFLTPGEEEDAWLADRGNWPRDVVNKTEGCRNVFADLVSRSSMIAMVITDERMGPMVVGEVFDWSANPDIGRIAEEMKGEI